MMFSDGDANSAMVGAEKKCVLSLINLLFIICATALNSLYFARK